MMIRKRAPDLYHPAVHVGVGLTLKPLACAYGRPRGYLPCGARGCSLGRPRRHPPNTGCPSAWASDRVKTVVARVNGNLRGGRNVQTSGRLLNVISSKGVRNDYPALVLSIYKAQPSSPSFHFISLNLTFLSNYLTLFVLLH